MLSENTTLRIIKIREKNCQAVKVYEDAFRISKNCEFSSYYKRFIEERKEFGVKLDEVLKNVSAEIAESYLIENTLVNGWIDFHYLAKEEPNAHAILQELLKGEEKARLEYDLVLTEDLTMLGDMRNLILLHINKIEHLIFEIEKVLD